MWEVAEVRWVHDDPLQGYGHNHHDRSWPLTAITELDYYSGPTIGGLPRGGGLCSLVAPMVEHWARVTKRPHNGLSRKQIVFFGKQIFLIK